MSERKRTLEQAEGPEALRMGMAQLRESIAAEMPWLSADEVNEVVDKELVTAAREIDEVATQQGDALSAQPSAGVGSAST